jgi:uncharacterized membrane protein YfcA
VATGLTYLIIAIAFVTALISGVFGMAGGLLLMGALGFLMSVPEAMALHGLIQAASNGSRAALLVRHVRWRILGLYLVGSLAAAAAFAGIAYAPSKAVLYMLLGAVPFIAWLPKERLHLDASKPIHAVLCGLLVTGLNVAAGVAGPLLDVFFVRSSLSRREVVATKAATQVVAHAIKIGYYGGALIATAPAAAGGVGRLFLIALPFTLAGTWAGARLLDRMSDDGFRRATRIIVTAIGVVYLVRGALLLAGWP